MWIRFGDPDDHRGSRRGNDPQRALCVASAAAIGVKERA